MFNGVEVRALCSGLVVILEGKLVDVSRHVITDINKGKLTLWISYIKSSQIHHRKCDAKGMEIEPNFSDTKKVNTGNLIIIQYLIGTLYTERSGGEIDRLTEVQLENLVTKEDLVNVTEKNCPSGTYTFWHPEGERDKIELETGQDIRLKTKGNGQFTSKKFSLAKVDGGTVTKCNFAGDEKAGASRTDKIMDNKSDVSNEVGGTGRGSR
ncbi:arpin-like [Oncorhynchus masou masou]|uniref:arpin-like n=1 Tax=Oncorhynchus masou masou TaxID=90313 RepID=UPI003183D40A